ncbi:VOC family protein [Lysobacter hankyongensis]|uniref:VOC family protein n=1 Tax=Lysobacter hankyongensis TaxID=1176535 RepID=A0ABP9B6I9_9GAMM
MPTSLFVNLPIADLRRSIDFFSALGFAFNPKFSNEDATCLVISEHIQVMLLTTPFFAGFTRKPVADAHAATEVLLALSCESRGEVDALVAKAVAAGAATPMAVQDHGFMYQHGFEDLDGHLWEVFWMNEAEFQQS